MPYVITTKRPDKSDRRPMHARLLFTESRRAVATLEEARQDARNAVEDRAQQPGWTDAYTAAREAARALPEAGGTIGPLPDGTVIEVTQWPYSSLAGVAGLTVEQMPTDAQIIDAYNARA